MEEISEELREGIVNYIQRRDIRAVPDRLDGKSLLFQLLLRIWGNTRHLPGAKMLLFLMNCAFVISLSSKTHCYVKNRNGLYLNRYRSNRKSVGSLLRASPK